MQSYVTSTRDGVYDETQTFRRRRGSLFYDGRTRNGSAFDIRSRPSLSEGLLPEQGSGKSLQRAPRLPDMDCLASQWWLGQPPRLGLLVRQAPRFLASGEVRRPATNISSTKGRAAVLMIKLMETREIAPYVWVHPDDDDRSDCLMCGHHDYFGGLCPPSSHFTASDFTGSDNTEVIKMCSHLLHSNVRRS
jgi:hypothetical protein